MLVWNGSERHRPKWMTRKKCFQYMDTFTNSMTGIINQFIQQICIIVMTWKHEPLKYSYEFTESDSDDNGNTEISTSIEASYACL